MLANDIMCLLGRKTLLNSNYMY